MSKILIIANFCGGMTLKSRFAYLANILTEQGHEMEIITSDFSHGLKRQKEKI